jgi:4-hydroxybenzoate polyprenyltransferase
MAGICWTLVYDTLYAYQDRVDDSEIGLKSLPLYLGDQPQVPLTILGTCMLGGLYSAGYLAELSPLYYIGISTHTVYSIYSQIWTADLNNNANLWSKFASNNQVGVGITISMILGHIPM